MQVRLNGTGGLSPSARQCLKLHPTLFDAKISHCSRSKDQTFSRNENNCPPKFPLHSTSRRLDIRPISSHLTSLGTREGISLLLCRDNVQLKSVHLHLHLDDTTKTDHHGREYRCVCCLVDHTKQEKEAF